MKKVIAIKYIIGFLFVIIISIIITNKNRREIISELNFDKCVAYQMDNAVVEIKYPDDFWSYDLFELNKLDGNEIRFWSKNLDHFMIMSIGTDQSYIRDFFPGYEKSELNFENSSTLVSEEISGNNIEYLISPNFTQVTFILYFNKSKLSRLDKEITMKILRDIKIYQSDKSEKKAIITHCRN